MFDVAYPPTAIARTSPSALTRLLAPVLVERRQIVIIRITVLILATLAAASVAAVIVTVALTVFAVPARAPRVATAPPRASTGLPQFGSPVTSGQFEYTLNAIQWDQDATVLAASPRPPVPAPGFGWALVKLTVRNISSDLASPGTFTVVLHGGGWDVDQSLMESGSARVPALFRVTDLRPGATATGNLGFLIPKSAAADPHCWLQLETWNTISGPPASYGFTCTRR